MERKIKEAPQEPDNATKDQIKTAISSSALSDGSCDIKDPNEGRHPKCLGTYDAHNGDYSCDYYTKLDCDECKYGAGRKDPEAKPNQ